jgi:hypothetical protein
VQIDSNFRRSPQYFVFVLWGRFQASAMRAVTANVASSVLSLYAGRNVANTSKASLLVINKQVCQSIRQVRAVPRSTLSCMPGGYGPRCTQATPIFFSNLYSMLKQYVHALTPFPRRPRWPPAYRCLVG